MSAGTFNDPGLRTHDLYKSDGNAVRRKSRRSALLGVAFAVALAGGGIAYRLSVDGEAPSVDAVLAKVPYWRELVQKVGH